MSSTPKMEDALREAILSQPDAVLDDKDVMNALIAANERAMGSNIVDLRGIAMQRMENRLDRLEDTHRSVIAAAYDNVAGTNQIHRASLRLLEAAEFEGFLTALGGEVADILRVDVVRLVLERAETALDPALEGLDDVLAIAAPGFAADYLTQSGSGSARQVTLRGRQHGSDLLFQDKAASIASEACLTLDLGPGRLPALLILGAHDPHMFGPQQGTDLLVFFSGVVERVLRRWLV